MKKRHSKKAMDKLLAKAEREMAEVAFRLTQINDDGSINRLAEVLARRINAYDQTEMIIRMAPPPPPPLFDRLVDANGDLFGEFRLFDSRVITAKQRKYINALCRDIKEYTGDESIDQVREDRKREFIELHQVPYFSTSELQANCSVEVASKFISYIVDFCLDNDIGLAESPLNYVDDIKHYLIKCLWTRKCALCGKKGQVHHVDAVGAGRNRKKIDHTKHHLMCLCDGHHDESHRQGQLTFMRKNHIVGIIMNQEQYEKLGYRG
jgi:hypothetical protein